MVDTKAVSVRLPLDLLNELNSYATDKGMVRGGDANIGGAIIAVLRQHFGEPDNVKQVSDNVDIESIVNDAIASKISEMSKEINDLKSTVNTVTKDFTRYRDIEIDDLTARVVALETNHSEATAPANFTPALLLKAKAVAPLMLQKVA
jgi:hypothetical protein